MGALPAPRREEGELEALREAIRRRFPHSLPDFSGRAAPAVAPPSESAPDPWRALFPRGRLEGGMHVLVRGAPSSGSSSLALALAVRAAERGERVAWIDGAGRFHPPAAADGGMDLARLVVCRPRSLVEAVQTAVPLLDCGGFGVVILDLLDLALTEARPRGGLRRGADDEDGPLVVASRRLLLALRAARSALVVLARTARPLPVPPMFEILVERPRNGATTGSLTAVHAALRSRSRTGALGPELRGRFGREEGR